MKVYRPAIFSLFLVALFCLNAFAQHTADFFYKHKGYKIQPHLKNGQANRVEIARGQHQQKKIKVELPR
jgi:hypothetical protein